MKYNDALANEYGTFSGMMGESPMPYKPVPSKKDYEDSYVTRTFAQKRNDNTTVEIKLAQASNINSELYKIVTADWAISGPKYGITKNNIIDQQGVVDQNKYEIDRVMKEYSVDLTRILSNPLEFWQGH